MSADSPDQFIHDIINMFLQQAPPLIHQIEEHCATKNYMEMSKVAHKLKGSAANLGTAALADICRTIEIAGKENSVKECNVMMIELRDIYNKTVLELRKIM